MGRSSEAKMLIEAERLAILHDAQSKMRRRLAKETKVKKKSNQPGEILLKKHTSVLLKIGVPGISYGDIADRLGETRSTVKEWFRSDPEVKDFYEWATAHLKDSALELMQTYGLEAVETLVLLMRYGSEKYMFEASKEILDRIGVIRAERRENLNENVESHKWADRDALVAEIRELNPEQQEAALEALGKFEELLAGETSTNGHVEIDDEDLNELSDLQPIARSEDEDEEDEDED